MQIWPAVDLRHGKVVQLIGGDPNVVAVERPSAEAQAVAWKEAGAKRLHVVDLDAAFGEQHQWLHLRRAMQSSLPVQFGGGIRSMTQVQQLLEMGVQRVIIGTQGVQNPEWLRELGILFPQKIVLAVDARGRDVQMKGWTESSGLDVVDLVAGLADAGLAGFLFTDVGREGRLVGFDPDVVAALREAAGDAELIISGGIASLDDLAALQELGVDGVVLGMSIYQGQIDLSEAVARFEVAP
ncbi:MAG: HisA/HisF-related TIM barrel protein [Thermoplasmatota archaeon]